MAESKKIILASVLKPVDEPRILHKLGLSLRETNKYRLYILGFPAKKASIFPEITFETLFNGKRISLSRFLAGPRLIWHILKQKPSLVIITTYELLPALCLAKWIQPFKAVYDIQEDYALNILYNQTLPKLFQRPLAEIIKAIERLGDHCVDWYLLAESCYLKGNKNTTNRTVLENKFQGTIQAKESVILDRSAGIHFVISGTLTEVYGVETAMRWFQALTQIEPIHRLTVIGHCPLESYQERLQILQASCPQIQLRTSSTPLPVEAIREATESAQVWLMPYHPIPSICDKMPTKLYEALALGIPVLITPNELWETTLSRYQAGLSVDFQRLDQLPECMDKLSTTRFYTILPGTEVTWESEKARFLQVIRQLLPNQ
ncbi:glycosyltransferase [Lunatimonas sp.]|uniref:glycosyltransferase n=1 Tax=Lunatimonas sp. TaxID=2060141 RepID=UPI00263A4654|nr:glycosyltransferase [Lunatimonas sp.]